MKAKTILLIEDNPLNLMLFEHVLLREGYAVQVAEDAHKALNLLQTIPTPDVIITDLALPGMDGFSLILEIKKNSMWRPIPILVLTAFAMTEDRDRVALSGCDGYMTKPVEIEKFLAWVQSFMGGENEPA
jgi:two-component system, cell cycle response regulator DivK